VQGVRKKGEGKCVIGGTSRRGQAHEKVKESQKRKNHRKDVEAVKKINKAQGGR